MNINQLFPELSRLDPALLPARVDPYEREWPISFIVVTIEGQSLRIRIHFSPQDSLQFHTHRQVLPRLTQLALAAGIKLDLQDASTHSL